MANAVVCGSGTLISSLLFKLKNVRGDAEGFLLGEVLSHQVNTISDSISEGSREEREICLHSFINLRKKHSFSSRTGTPDVEKLSQLLGNRHKDVVGWFSYRPNSSHRLSMRERVLHTRLASCFDHLDKKDFVLALVTEQLPDVSAICTTEYSFLCWDNKFVSVSSKLSTLPASVPYQLSPTYPHSHTHYTDTLQSHRSKFIQPDETVQQSVAVRDLCADLLTNLQPLSQELLKTALDLEQARHEVEILRAEVSAAQMKAEQNSRPSSSDGTKIMENGTTTPAEDNTLTPRENTADTALLIDFDGTEAMRTCEPSAPPAENVQLPDLLGDCVIIPDSPENSDGGEGQGGGGSGIIEPLIPLTNHTSLSQELF